MLSKSLTHGILVESHTAAPTLLMCISAEAAMDKTWRRLKGENQLPMVVEGIKFADGVAVTTTPNQRPAWSAASPSSDHSSAAKPPLFNRHYPLSLRPPTSAFVPSQEHACLSVRRDERTARVSTDCDGAGAVAFRSSSHSAASTRGDRNDRKQISHPRRSF